LKERNVQRPKLNILFAGGGTGGHLFPAIAIADEIRKIRPDATITFVGTRDRIEARVVPVHGYKFVSIWISGFRRKWTLEHLLFPVKLMVALAQSFIIISRSRPNVVVGTGGYVCGPVVFVATLLGKPTLLQEQNSHPGVTTRLLAPRVSEVHLTFDLSRQFLERQDNVRVSGNPIRATLGAITEGQGRAFFQLDAQKQTVLVFGGSLGASSINSAVLKVLADLVSSEVQVVWQTGDAEYERIRTEVTSRGMTANVKVYKFIEHMEYAYGACDLAICRAGATTVAELACVGVPAILVPYPYAAADHQKDNAAAMADAGAAIVIPDAKLDNRLLAAVKELLADRERLNAMSECALAMGKPRAAATLAQAVLALAGQP
jgi:UDP-N-acetylglucosamine--N-acetylmuramyl-(pentapeptide) pyrophosphoryl-undecaprenol N-acetylglucosamine transferase